MHDDYRPYCSGCSQALERQHQDTSQKVLWTLEPSPCMDHTCRINETNRNKDNVREVDSVGTKTQ